MESKFFGELSVIGMRGSENFVAQVDQYLREWRGTDESFIVTPICERFGTGEAKCMLPSTMRGHDTYIFADLYNYGVTIRMYGKEFPMSPDDHFQDLKRIIGAIGGKARRISVIMPMLYESRQDKRTMRESLDCAMALQELERMGVSNIITFDVHSLGVQNAIPLCGFDNVHPTYQMLKALVREVPDIEFHPEKLMIIAPDEGGVSRCLYYSSVLKLDLGMFYKRRDYTRVINGKNPIVAHEYLGRSVEGMDVIIVDDIIASGESMLSVAKQLKDKGARRIFIFVTFAFFTEGLDSFDRAYEEGYVTKLFTTNLIYHPQELIVRPWYAEANMCKYVSLIIDTLNRDQSISSLLNPVERIQNLLRRHAAGESLSAPRDKENAISAAANT
ncbi:MAG TPA: ribose-phosphate pyrophosphokinase [Bacillota bacterium]|nr:ribose-phosphate pyrophosphokinase [Bacillota bacterium]